MKDKGVTWIAGLNKKHEIKLNSQQWSQVYPTQWNII